MEVHQESFGVSPSGERLTKWTISNGAMKVSATDLGATVLEVLLPRKDGKGFTNVAPCHQSAAKLCTTDLGENPKMGTTCGRVCNRTANARFELDGAVHELAKNDGAHHIHGGAKQPFDQRVWSLKELKVSAAASSVTLQLESADGEEGYPGALHVECCISLTGSNEMGIEYSAINVDTKASVVSLTNHCYWALHADGLAHGSVQDHTLQLHSDEYVPSDPSTYIPTGGLASADHAPQHDWRAPKRVGDMLALEACGGGDITKGYNMSYVVRGFDGSAAAPEVAAATGCSEAIASVHDSDAIARLRPAGVLSEPTSGRSLTISTSHPCIHLYTCFAWDSKYTCEGSPMTPSSCLALECQLPADCCNQAFGEHIKKAIIRPGETYRHLTVHRFAW
jgi:aldose 1-epimerase